MQDCFSLYHLNAHSIVHKKDKLIEHLQSLDTNFKFICITESWLNEDSIPYSSIEGYNAEHSVRDVGSIGGGASVYVHHAISYAHRPDLSMLEPGIESCFIEVDKSELLFEKDVIVGCIYRPPGKSIEKFIEKIDRILDVITKEGKIGFLAGDYNINILNHDKHKPTSDFLDKMYSYSFLPLITKPTRITDRTATLIDNIFTNHTSSTAQQFPGIIFNDMSDHLPVFCFDKTIQLPNKKMNIKNAYIEKAISKISNQKYITLIGIFYKVFQTPKPPIQPS